METWGKTPSEFYDLPAYDRNLMTSWARHRLRNIHEAVESAKTTTTDDMGLDTETTPIEISSALLPLMIEFF